MIERPSKIISVCFNLLVMLRWRVYLTRCLIQSEFVLIVKGCLSSSHKLFIILRSELERHIFSPYSVLFKFEKHFYPEEVCQTKTFFGNINFTKLTNSGSFSQALHYQFLATIYPIESRVKKKAPIITNEVDTDGNLENSTIKHKKPEPKPEEIQYKCLLMSGKFYEYTKLFHIPYVYLRTKISFQNQRIKRLFLFKSSRDNPAFCISSTTIIRLTFKILLFLHS